MSAETLAARLNLTTQPGYAAYTAASDPNHLLGRHNEYTSKVNWGSNQDNSIEVFASAADAQARKAYVFSFQCPFGDGYDYLAGTVLLRLSCDDTPSQAQALKARLQNAMR